MSSVYLNILQWKKLKPNFSAAVNKKRLLLADPQSCCSAKRLLSGWYPVMLFPDCVNSRKCNDHRFLKCSNYAELYSLFYFTLIIRKHNPSSVSYCLWKLFLMSLFIYYQCLECFFSYGVCFSLFSLTSIPDSKTCVFLTILIKTAWHVTYHPFV